jgi:N-acetylmuramoyl-L-alanine amidase
MNINRSAIELDILAATIYAEARGESREGQLWVGWVIKNRAKKNRGYWGGDKIKSVCLHPNQFECWNGRSFIMIEENDAWCKVVSVANEVLGNDHDPTNGCDHYNNPSKEGYPEWTRNVTKVKIIGNHHFYKGY